MTIALVSWAEMEDLLGVRRSTLGEIVAAPTFPEPVARLASGQIWLRADVERWAAKRRAGLVKAQVTPKARRPRKVPRLVGPAEAAELIGVQPRRFHKIRQRADFPRPITLALGPVWVADDVEAWNDQRRDRVERFTPQSRRASA